MCGGIWWCLDHIWWCLVVSGACLVVSGARLVMLMDIDWYDLIWCIWADIFSNAYNRCTDAADAADALMLLINWCYWSNDAAVVDRMQICVRAHLKGIALSSKFRTVVQCLVVNNVHIFFWMFLTIFGSFETCDIWDTDYSSDNREPEFKTIFVNWPLRVTLDNISNSCDVCTNIFGCTK